MEGTEWMAEEYAVAQRTAWLLCGQAADLGGLVTGAFERVWRFRATVGDGPAARPWLYRVLVAGCASIGTEAEAAPSPDACSGDGPGHLGLAELPTDLRAAVVLRYFTGLSERQTAVALRRRPAVVRARLAEARRLMAPRPGRRSDSTTDLEVGQ